MLIKYIRSSISITMLCLFLFVSLTNAEVRKPAEFDPQDAVWLAWACFDYSHNTSMTDLQMEMIKALAPYQKVKLIVIDENMRKDVETMLKKNNIPSEHVSYHYVPFGEMWLRDMGPDYIIDSQGKKKLVDFNFNYWGLYPHEDEFALIEEAVDREIAKEQGLEWVMTRLTGEGGNREFNGRGTLMVTEAVEMQRNPNVSKAQMEAEYERLFGVTKVIWLPEGLMDDSLANAELPGPNGGNAYGYGTGGHIDEYARFVGPNTILLADEYYPEAGIIEAENKKRMSRNYEILRKATDQDGKPFNIVRIPTAATEYIVLTAKDQIYEFSGMVVGDGSGHKGSIDWIPAKSYANFLITNKVILAASYWKAGMSENVKKADEMAVAALKSVFPNRKIITINPMAANVGGGGMHCISMQEPTVK